MGKWRHAGLHINARRRRWTLRMLINAGGGLCRYCQKPVVLEDGPRRATIEHVVPLSRGGLDKLENLTLACYRCNQEKGGDGVAFDVFVEGEADG